jgi:hypothetical protein
LVRVRFRDGRVHDMDLGPCTCLSVRSTSAAVFSIERISVYVFFSGTFADCGFLHAGIFVCF